MKRSPRRLSGVCAALILTAAPAAAVELQPFLSGLVNPLYLTHARDGSGRLFVLEQAGVIKVLGSGATTPSVFLDITDRVLAGGERGLLGLAFHPGYAANGRFFVNYTRRPDGATVIAEYLRSADPIVASRAETVLLTIAHPFSNHNGGSLEFGPDRLLYIGTGDGGSANDPSNRAQNVGDLLGKILRVDVDSATGGLPYGIPPDNPFVSAPGARSEVYALGLRNPYRFSFDRATGQLFAGDVGQGAVEEIDVVAHGANLGWRVFEGTRCTGLGPASCSSAGFTPPVAEYTHAGGRCSVTGGYVYRGTRGAFPVGTYLFADFCSGEIFTLTNGASAVLMDTPLRISSFGEDEAGEIYVVDLGGTIHRLVAEPHGALVAAVLPASRSVMVGTPATAFATIINVSDTVAVGCSLSLVTPIAAHFQYQTTNPATNAVSGTPNTAVDLGPRASQSFVFAITPTAPFAPIEVALGFQCQNRPPAPVFARVNTLLLSADTIPVLDMVALIAFRPDSGGLVDLPGATGIDVFAVAGVNVGAGGTVTVSADTGGAPLPVVLSICQIDAQAQCLAPPAASVALGAAGGATSSYAVFATGTGSIPFDPANHRINVRFFDAAGVVRGATSAAVQTR